MQLITGTPHKTYNMCNLHQGHHINISVKYICMVNIIFGCHRANHNRFCHIMWCHAKIFGQVINKFDPYFGDKHEHNCVDLQYVYMVFSGESCMEYWSEDILLCPKQMMLSLYLFPTCTCSGINQGHPTYIRTCNINQGHTTMVIDRS